MSVTKLHETKDTQYVFVLRYISMEMLQYYRKGY